MYTYSSFLYCLYISSDIIGQSSHVCGTIYSGI